LPEHSSWRPERQPPDLGQKNGPASERPLWVESGRKKNLAVIAGLPPSLLFNANLVLPECDIATS
jgi:hypothetical protein